MAMNVPTLLRALAISLCCLICAAPAFTQADTDKSEVEKRFTQLMAAGERKQVPWRVVVSKPYLGDFQRLEVYIWVRVSTRELARRGPQHDLLLIAGVADSSGQWLPSGGTWVRQSLEQIPTSVSEIPLGVLAFVRPGEYSLGVVLCDDPYGLCNVTRQSLRVKPLRHDPLPELWKDLPAAEFLGPSESDEDRVVKELNLPAAPPRSVRVEVLANLTGSEHLPYWINAPCEDDMEWRVGVMPGCMNLPPARREPGRYRQYYSTPESVLYALRVLGELRVSSGSLHVTGVETTRRRVLFREDVDKGLDWSQVRAALKSFNPDTIDLVDLQERRRNASFFREVLAERLTAGDLADNTPGDGAPSRPKRVLIVLTGETIFARGTDRKPLRLKESCNCRVYYLRFESSRDAWDELGKVLSALKPRRFVIRNPEDFRKALAEILRDLRQF